jgi:serine/threonine protein phosphatase PrpC
MNITNLKFISDPGTETKPNEDGVIILENLYVVLDGATGLGNKKIERADSDARWFVNYLSTYFNEHWSADKRFIHTLKKAVTKANRTFDNITNLTQAPESFEMPSTGVVAVHIFTDHIKAYRIGDCSLYIQNGNVITDVFGNSPLEALDEISIVEMNKALKNGLSYIEARDEIKDILKKNRSKMNTKDGYTVLSIDPESVHGVEEKRISLPENSVKLLLTSDGFSALHEKYNHTILEVFEEVNKLSLKEMIRKIRNIEINDKDLLKFPRLKAHDDATCIYFNIER